MSELRLREFEELVLLSVLVVGEGAYGASVQRVLKEEAHRTVTLGAIYTALDRLTRKGLVCSEMSAPTPVRGGRSRRQYQLTPEGFQEVGAVRKIRERLWERVDRAAFEGGVGQ